MQVKLKINFSSLERLIFDVNETHLTE